MHFFKYIGNLFIWSDSIGSLSCSCFAPNLDPTKLLITFLRTTCQLSAMQRGAEGLSKFVRHKELYDFSTPDR